LSTATRTGTFSLRPAEEWVSPEITVLDNGHPVKFTLDTAMNYHGYDAVGGVALGFRLLQRAIAILSPDVLPERRQFEVFTNFPGLGVRDTFELVTRMVTGGRFTLDASFVDPRTPEGVTGGVYFRFSYNGKTVELAPIEGQPSERFVRCGRASKRPDVTEDELLEWKEVKHELANLLLGVEAENAVRIL